MSTQAIRGSIADDYSQNSVSGVATSGSLNGRTVAQLQAQKEDDVSSSASSKALKVLAAILMIVSLAAIIFGLLMGAGMIVAGTSASSFVLFSSFTAPITAVLGTKLAIAAASVAGFVGLTQLIGSIVILNKANADAEESIRQGKLELQVRA